MKIDRSKEWWLERIKDEGDYEIGAGVPDKLPWQWPQWALEIRALFAWTWRIGLIKRTTAFRWEMDRLLGVTTRRATERTDNG